MLPADDIASEQRRTAGLVFIIVGGLTIWAALGLVFLVVGIWLRYGHHIRLHTKITALERGHATRGKIVRIDRWQVGDKPQYRLTYEFDDRGKKRRGKCKGFDPSLSMRAAGDEMWVVSVPGQGRFRSALWPPVF